jgi:pyruvate/2-oxoglutarate/acetoin dehydrogenase E1 component
MIRHCVEESNVDDDMNVIDPNKIRHVTVAGGKIELMSGLIDPTSHLNLDFPDHRVTICIIGEAFEIGASVKMDGDGLVFATVPRSLFRHYGYLDYTQRLVDMIKAVKRNQENGESRQAARPVTEV